MPPWELLSKALVGSELEDFDFGIPLILKGEDPATGRRVVKGVASTSAIDLQDEEVIQKGLDVKYFVKHGYYNDDHKPGFSNKVGQPEEALIKTVTDSLGKNVLGLWTKGFLWPKGTHKGSDAIWELAKALEASDSNRRLGFSIQGKVLQRDGKRIVKAWIQDIAITPSPVNTSTWMDVVTEMNKSMWATAEDVDELKKSITPEVFMREPLIEEPWRDVRNLTLSKAMQTGGPLQTQSLDDQQKLSLAGTKKEQDDIAKAINFAYQEFRRRGYGEGVARGAALATVARSILA